MATADGITTGKAGPRVKTDERGRLIPPIPEELLARAELIRAALERSRAIESPPDEDDAEFFRALDESHPGRFNLERFYKDDNGSA